MAVRGEFRRKGRTPRSVDVEDSFALGIKYVDTPLLEGQARLVVNYVYKDRGEIIRPRGGFQTFSDLVTAVSDSGYYIHHVGSLYVEEVDNSDASLRRYVVIGLPDPTNFGIAWNTAQVFVEDPLTNVLHASTLALDQVGTPLLKHSTNEDWKALHGQAVTEATPVAINASLASNTYGIFKDGADSGICRIRIRLETGAYTHKLEEVTPQVVTPSQAVNNGYNMLLDSPYAFPITQNTSGNLQATGILPYDENDNLKFNARTSEEVTFKLIYTYPTGSPTYKVQWETQQLGVQTGVQIEQAVADSPTYNGGDEIAITLQPPYKQFSVICKVFDPADLSQPLKVIVLASYYLSTDQEETNRNIDVGNYDLATARGACSFYNRMVLWGVQGARNVLFLSDTNNPSYFPYPRQIAEVSEDILHAVVYLDQLIVFTETKLIAYTYDPANGGLTRKIIQENLDMNYFDRNTIKVIKNLVYFKSDNYYYMIVPNSNAGPGELQLAPVSTPIENLLDNFTSAIQGIVDEVYNIDFTVDTNGQAWTLQLVDFYNYLDGDKIDNVYKYSLSYGATTLYIEVHLVYDTLMRNWSMLIVETNNHKLIPYRQLATENTVFTNIYLNQDGFLHLQLLRRNEDDAKDTFALDNGATRVIKNYQLLDTGKRSHFKDFKKTFREIQVNVNNISGEDIEFYDNFFVDDDERTKLFNYTVEQVTDTNAPNYGTIYVSREYVDPNTVPGTTRLDSWALGVSAFPPLTVLKVRMKVSGKGYHGRLKLLCTNETMYEILNHNWVYRLRNAR